MNKQYLEGEGMNDQMEELLEKRRKVFEKYTKGKKVTSESYVDGKCVAVEYGELDFDRLMKRLLECKYIVG